MMHPSERLAVGGRLKKLGERLLRRGEEMGCR
jgi:hypothetical protein